MFRLDNRIRRLLYIFLCCPTDVFACDAVLTLAQSLGPADDKLGSGKSLSDYDYDSVEYAKALFDSSLELDFNGATVTKKQSIIEYVVNRVYAVLCAKNYREEFNSCKMEIEKFPLRYIN